MKKPLRTAVRTLARTWGYDIVKYQEDLFTDVDQVDIETIRSIGPHTMVGPEATCALVTAVRYVVKNNIPGDIVECGVWRGGSMMAVARTLRNLNHSDKQLYLFDTFEGMPKPASVDVSVSGDSAVEEFERTKIDGDRSSWMGASLDEVKDALYSTGYDRAKIHFIKGKSGRHDPRQRPPDHRITAAGRRLVRVDPP